MRPIQLLGHTRSLTQVKYNREGDLIFTVGKDKVMCVWYSSNGERIGTYNGHIGAIWTVDVDPTTTLVVSGAADNTMRLWNVKTGQELKRWEYESSIRRVEFSPDGTQLLAVNEKRSKIVSSIFIYDIKVDINADQRSEHALRIVCDESKATVATFSYAAKYIIVGHENGTVSRYDAKSGELIDNTQFHEGEVTDIQWSPDRTYFITSSKDKTAKLIAVSDMSVLHTYVADTPLNSASIVVSKDFVIVGGGQAAIDVTTSSTQEGKFESRFHHKLFEDEIGRVPGHFGPLNYVACSPTGKSYCSASEDGYARLHHFDPDYFEFQYEVEREREAEMSVLAKTSGSNLAITSA